MDNYDSSCCVCSLPFPRNSPARKKRRLFHNDPCEEVRRFFSEVLLKNLQLSLDSFKETRDSRGYLCHSCVSNAKAYFNLHNELRKKEDEVVSHFSHLRRIDDEVISSQSRSNCSNTPSTERVRMTNRGREEDEATPNTSNARKRQRTTMSSSQSSTDVAPTSLATELGMASNLQSNSEVTPTSFATPSLVPRSNTRIHPDVTVSRAQYWSHLCIVKMTYCRY